MNRNIIAKMINEKDSKSEEELLHSLQKKLEVAESAGNYKAQADYWKEQHQNLRKQCFRALSGKNGLKRLSEMLEEDIYPLTN
ncbi:MAG: hypothetical protein N4A74_26840 [Carboxylicivirga sp.]|jgi:uncharacterized membrane protein YgaE (UPF0421/DUF939 family)|nr:hypothetical protein [Carboxylicivirga sp.]